ncbi:MAG: condensation domain-containing protein [Sulfitobacter sp.]
MQTFPLTAWQQFSVLLAQHPKASPNFMTHTSHSIAMRVTPQLSERRLRRAFAELCARHDVTRMVIDLDGAKPKCCILDDRMTGMGVYDYAGSPESEIEAITHSHARDLLPLVGQEMVRLDLLRFGDLGDVVVFRVHACLTDGFGMTLMRDDLMKFYFRVPIPTRALSYGAYYSGWGSDRAMSDAKTVEFWEDNLRAPPSPPRIGRIKRGLPILESGLTWQRAADFVCDVGEDHARQLHQRAKAAGTTAFMLVNTAFLQTVAQLGDTDDVLYSLTLGRHDRRLFQYAGHHALHPLMRFRNVSGLGLLDAALVHAQDWQATLDHLPALAARKGGPWDDRLVAAGSYPRQIMTGSRMPINGARQSLDEVAETPSADKPIQILSMELSEIKMPHEPGDFDELVLRAEFQPTGSALQFRYDTEAYAEDEIAEIADATFSRLGFGIEKIKTFS